MRPIGRDFSQLRVHAEPRVGRSADAVDAGAHMGGSRAWSAFSRDVPSIGREAPNANGGATVAAKAFDLASVGVRAADPSMGVVDPDARAEGEARSSAARITGGLQAPAASLAPSAAGGALPAPVRRTLEPVLGVELSQLRVHAGARAAQLAAALQARAFTIGRDVYFGAGEYGPQTSEGLRLVAHEATHAIQQGAVRGRGSSSVTAVAGSIQRQPVGHKRPPSQAAATPKPRPELTIPWTGSVQSSLFDYMRALGLDDNRALMAARAINAKASAFTIGGEPVSRGEFEQKARGPALLLDAGLSALVAQATGIDIGVLTKTHEATMGQEQAQAKAETRGVLPGQEQREREAVRWSGPREPIAASWTVLHGNEPLARLYLRLMENFAGVQQTPETRAKAAGGLTDEELISIIAGSGTRQIYTNLFTQGFAEFQQAGGTDVDRFARLEETIFQQFAWGNTTAARNQLRVGYGSPEQGILGIADRQSGFLLYDSDGQPLRSFAGTRVRDTGYIGAPQPDWVLVNIANIEDPGLRDFLNALRLAVVDPLRMIGHAASVYMDNMPVINATIEQGLTKEILEKFEDMLDVFIGFVAGHALSAVLIASANPALSAIGAALKGLLVAAGYIMDIDFGAGALKRLFEAGYHFSRVVKNPDGSFTELAKFHLEEGAKPIRSMIADVVTMWVAARAGESIGESMHSKEIESIECNTCRFGRRERRARARIKEASELGNFGWTRTEIEGARRELREREAATNPEEVKHTNDHASHGVPKDTMIKTINDPQVVMLAANGNWVFYRTGTIVITKAGDVNAIQTAFGEGAKLPERHVDLFNNTLYRGGPPKVEPARDWVAGDVEPAVDLNTFQSQNWGDPRFTVVRILTGSPPNPPRPAAPAAPKTK